MTGNSGRRCQRRQVVSNELSAAMAARPGTDRSDEVATSRARPFGREESLRSRRERSSEVGEVTPDRECAHRHRGGDPDDRSSSADQRSPPSHDGDQGDRHGRCDDQRPLEGVEHPTCSGAEHHERDREQPEPDAHQADHDMFRHRSTNSGADAAANAIPGAATAPSPIRTTVIRSTAPKRLDGPDGPVTINTEV